MKFFLLTVFAGFFAMSNIARAVEETPVDVLFAPADMTDLSEFVWKKRPVLVFADNENDPAYVEQLELLHENEAELIERDVIILTDTDPAARSALRTQMRPRGFMLVIIGKDGGVKLRKPFPWDVREITRSIDKMPIRQREIRDEKERHGNIIE